MHGIRVGRFLGIELRADWSILVLFGLLTWEFAALALPKIATGYAVGAYWAVALVTTAVFVVTLAAHELCHSVAARNRGIRVHGITLWMLGGIATIDGIAKTPRDDFTIAIAGPAASAAIGAAGIGVGLAGVAVALPRIVVAGILWVAMINLLLAVFNMAPAAPLDGGRVLRAWIWHRTGDRDSATIAAARAGEVFAVIVIGAGIAMVALGGDVTGVWPVVLGWFVLRAARREEGGVTPGSERPLADAERTT